MPKKTKPFVRALCVLLALVAALSLTMVTAFAEELPVERATENSATVSDEVDTADNSDPHMGTTYYMYLAPDIVATTRHGCERPQHGCTDPAGRCGGLRVSVCVCLCTWRQRRAGGRRSVKAVGLPKF